MYEAIAPQRLKVHNCFFVSIIPLQVPRSVFLALGSQAPVKGILRTADCTIVAMFRSAPHLPMLNQLTPHDLAFAECAVNRTITATWVCRQQRLAMNSCMIAHAKPEEEDRAREEWFAGIEERRRARDEELAGVERRRAEVQKLMREDEIRRREAKK